VIGRDLEAARIATLVDGLATGRPFVLTVRGEPGSGRSSLLDRARELAAAAGARPLAARGVSGDHEPAYGALSSLLRPLDGAIDGLVEDLAPDLRRALSLEGGAVDDDRVALATLRVLAGAAHSEPLIVLLDDTDAMDAASTAALAFSFGRLGVDRVGVVVVAGPGAGPFDDVATDVLPLSGLPERALARIVTATAACSEPVAATLAGWADGSPLLAIELALSLTEAERDGSEPLPPTPRRTVTAAEHLRRELDALPADQQRAAVVVAADRTGRLDVVVPALAALGEDPAALDRAEASRVVRIDGPRVSFRHALMRPLALRLVAAASRRAAHRALATALVEPRQAADRIVQLVASCAGPDPEVADVLDLLAESESRRGSPATAARASEAAARLSADAADRARRLIAAAVAAAEAEQRDDAVDLAEQAAAAAPGTDHDLARRVAEVREAVAADGIDDGLAGVLSRPSCGWPRRSRRASRTGRRPRRSS
jgi:hypothetical protein